MRSMYLKILVLMVVFSFFGCSDNDELITMDNDVVLETENISKMFVESCDRIYFIKYTSKVEIEDIPGIRSHFFNHFDSFGYDLRWFTVGTSNLFDEKWILKCHDNYFRNPENSLPELVLEDETDDDPRTERARQE